jgi:putative transposase
MPTPPPASRTAQWERYSDPCFGLDNHPVHHAKRLKQVLRWFGIGLRFTAPASPWQNGRIERFFGTLKRHLQGLRFVDASSLACGLSEFRHYHNHVRVHQHLSGRTPADVWRGIDPWRRRPRHTQWFEGWGGRLRGWHVRH